MLVCIYCSEAGSGLLVNSFSFPDPCLRKECGFYGICQRTNQNEASCICPVCASTVDYEPICGSDDQTYSSECAMKTAGCKEQTEIFVYKRTSCGRLIHNV